MQSSNQEVSHYLPSSSSSLPPLAIGGARRSALRAEENEEAAEEEKGGRTVMMEEKHKRDARQPVSRETVPTTTTAAASVAVTELPQPQQQQCGRTTTNQGTATVDRKATSTKFLGGVCNAGGRLGKYGIGVGLILVVAVIWVAASLWIQHIFGSLHYDKPFFLTYFNTAGFMGWNMGYLVSESWRKTPWRNKLDDVDLDLASHIARRNKEDDDADDDYDDVDEDLEEDGGTKKRRRRRSSKYIFMKVATIKSTWSSFWGSPAGVEYRREADEAAGRRGSSIGGSTRGSRRSAAVVDYGADGGGGVGAPSRAENSPNQEETTSNSTTATTSYSLYRIFHCALLFCPMWFLANCLFNYSLSRTSVASNTVLSTTSSVWTLLLSRWLIMDPVNGLKVVAIALSIGGTTMVAFSDDNNNSSADDGDSMSGDVLALISAFFYGAYTTVLRWCLPDDDKYSMGMAFGAVGVINTVIMWPGFILLHYSNIEPFELPTWNVLWPLLLNTVIGTNLSDVLWAKSVILTSPLVATLGLSLTTPIAMIADAVLQGQRYSVLYICGACIVTSGFVVANLPGDRIAVYLLGGADGNDDGGGGGNGLLKEGIGGSEGNDAPLASTSPPTTSHTRPAASENNKKKALWFPSPLLETLLGVHVVPISGTTHVGDAADNDVQSGVGGTRAGGCLVTLRTVSN